MNNNKNKTVKVQGGFVWLENIKCVVLFIYLAANYSFKTYARRTGSSRRLSDCFLFCFLFCVGEKRQNKKKEYHEGVISSLAAE